MRLSLDTYLEQSLSLKRRTRFAEAVELLQQAIRTFPDEPGLYDALGSTLWEMGEKEQSVRAWQQSVQLDPEMECPRLILAHHLSDLGRFEESIQVLAEGVHASPHRHGIWLTEIAGVYLRMGDVVSAISYCDQALALDPGDGVALALKRNARFLQL